MNLSKIKTKDHPSNLDPHAVLVCEYELSKGSVYKVSGHRFVAVLTSPHCLAGTFETVGKARQAIKDHYKSN